MKYSTFGELKSTYKICILVNDIRMDEIEKIYIKPYNLNKDDIIIIDLYQAEGKKKTPMKDMRSYITEQLSEELDNLQIEYLVIGDAEYFKAFTKSTQADRMVGYVIDSAFGSWKCIYVPNYRTLFYDPQKIGDKIKLGINALRKHIGGDYIDPGMNIIEFEEYPMTVEDIADWLQKLHQYPALTCDIEGYSLKHYDCGIGTITFCWSKTEGIAFPIDILNDVNHAIEVRQLLKEFFIEYEGKLIYHYISFDVMVLIYQLFMEHILDTNGLLIGLEIMLKNWDDTKLIAYLATNSCAGNKLSLKDQAQEYAGNYAVESINDITKIPLDQLLKYNLVDGLSTWFTYEKHWDTLIRDNQLDIYNNIFKPAIIDIIQMQLTGMPIDMPQVLKVEKLLIKDRNASIFRMNETIAVQEFQYRIKEDWVIKRNDKLKVKRVTVADCEEEFNPNSGPQLIKLIYEQMGLPIIDLTDTKLPATGAKTLEKLKNHTSNPDHLAFLDALIDYNSVDIILGTFIEAFKKAQLGADGWYYLFGNFNLGGTVSGRLSSSGPNLQNLPAGGDKGSNKARYAKLVKSCFKAPTGWLFCGLDFASLEDRISALTTKDPQKLAVYIQGFDGHSMRAHAYFGDQMINIIAGDVISINSIAKLYPELRQESKAPTFALTYQGTFITLMNNCGFPEIKAKDVETKYHELYKVSDAWVEDKLQNASKDGYITAAFGLRVRTPLLHQVIRGTKKTPFAAEAEGRTAGNALGQSWCLLNSRAGSEFMGKVRKSEYCLDIRPCAQIHDAQYFLIRDDIQIIKYANDNLVQAVEWQADPEIYHPDVKLGGELSIFYPDWSQEIGVKNHLSCDEIQETIRTYFEELEKKKAA